MMQRYAAFGLCILGAALLFFLALVHLPMVVLSPSRFVVPFCLCNILLFVSFGFLHGFVSYAKHLFSSGRWPYSLALFISTGSTLYGAMGIKSYILTVIMAIIQMLSMAAYFISYLPGGSSGIRMFGIFASNSIRSQISPF
jgi:hypothetical protein